MVTSVAEPLYLDSAAVFVSVSKLYLKSPSVYSMVSAFIAMLIAVRREMVMNFRNDFFILRCFLPMASSWRFMEMWVDIQMQRTWSQSCPKS